jgi:type I restriction enzyme M protein
MERAPDEFALDGGADFERSNRDLPEAFKKLYYHLYTNSRASRAETIIEDLSLLLLVDLAKTTIADQAAVDAFAAGKKTADSTLLPLVKRAFPNHLSKDQRFSLGDKALRDALRAIEGLDIAHAPAHSIGEAFQALIGPRLRGEKGQFFTPKSLVRAMVRIVDPQPNESVLDPAAGTGGFLAETHIYQGEKFGTSALAPIVGSDKDQGLVRLGNALLTVLCRGRGQIHNLNSLDAREWRSAVGKSYEESFDVVLTNPPFGAKIGVKDPDVLAQYDFGKVWAQNSDGWSAGTSLSGGEDPQVLFLEMCVKALKPGGRLGIVLPEGMFGNRQTSYIWSWLRARGEITALLDCPRTTFQPGTDTKTNVLFFRRAKAKTVSSQKKVGLAVAIHCGHDRRGRAITSRGEPFPDDFEGLARAYSTRKREGWRFEALGPTDYLVPRYHFYKADAGVDDGIAEGASVKTLGELVAAKLVSVRKGHEVGSEAYGTGDVPFVRTSDITNFEISTDPTKSVSDEVYAQYAPQQRLKSGDILMVVDGRYKIGTTAILDEHSVRAVAQSHLRIISVSNPSELDPYALLYALNLPSVKLHLRGLVFIQSTLGTLGSRLLELKVPLFVGEGPWTARVQLFKEALQKRGRLLAELRTLAGSEVEL